MLSGHPDCTVGWSSYLELTIRGVPVHDIMGRGVPKAPDFCPMAANVCTRKSCAGWQSNCNRVLSAGVRDASGHSCMERISFLESEGSNLRDACSRVAVEYPQACGACAPQGSPMDPAQRDMLELIGPAAYESAVNASLHSRPFVWLLLRFYGSFVSGSGART